MSDDETIADTGFDDLLPDPSLTAAVSPPVPVGLTEEGIEAAKIVLKLPDLTQQELAKLARELAMNIREVHQILPDYHLTHPQFEFLKEYNQFFKQALKTMTLEWNSALTTPERIKIEAAAIMEESLLVLAGRMQNKAEGLPGVVEAGKLIAKIAGLGEREERAGPIGERFAITINLGGGAAITHQTKTIEGAPAAGTSAAKIRIDTEGK